MVLNVEILWVQLLPSLFLGLYNAMEDSTQQVRLKAKNMIKETVKLPETYIFNFAQGFQIFNFPEFHMLEVKL